MPPGIPRPPGTVPLELLVIKLGLGEPQHKIAFIPLVGILLHVVPHAHKKLLFALVGEHIIVLQLSGIKIDIAARLIGVTLFQQYPYHMDELRHAARRRLHHVRGFDI